MVLVADQTTDVLCVGIAVQDVLLSVEGYPPADAKVRVSGVVEQGGGLAATAAVAVARLGGRAALVAAVGDDPRGAQMLEELAREGVDVSACRRCVGAVSPFSTVVVDRFSGTRTIFFCPGSTALPPDAVEPSLVRGARVLLVDALRVEAAERAALVAREAGIPVVFDAGEPGPEPRLMALADYPIPPLWAAREVSGEGDPERAALALLRAPAKGVIVTMGPAGYVVATSEGLWREAAFEVETVDTTGAGDAFHGAFALGLAWGYPVRRAARLGAAVAALKCRKPGGRMGLPGFAEVRALVDG